MTHRDAWLFLPPEVEALVPSLLARLATTGQDDPDPLLEASERERIETLVLEGDVDGWRRYLRSTTELVARTPSRDDTTRATLAAILDDQFILARAVVDLDPLDHAARGQLAGLVGK
jgi:hypothetical protein